jgi:hypothetical protein
MTPKRTWRPVLEKSQGGIANNVIEPRLITNPCGEP